MNAKHVGAMAALTIAIGVASYMWLAHKPRPDLEILAVGQAEGSVERSLQEATEIKTPVSAAGSLVPEASKAPNPFPEVPRSRTGMDMEDDPFNAESIAEQDWLDRHGYPNARQWAAYNLASDGLLQQAADSGDLTAQTILDGRRLPDRASLDRLMLSAVDGNNFALEQVSAHHAARGEVVGAYAIARVSEMRGNISAAVAREMLFREPLAVEQRMAGEVEALKLNATLNRLYMETHGESFHADERPITIKQNADM